MIGNNLVCTICNLEASTQGCVCDGSIILLGNNCLREHLLDRSMDHNLVDLDLALRMQENPGLVDNYLEEREEIIKMLRLIREHSRKIDPLKAKYEQDKQILISRIQETLNQPAIEMEKITKEYSEKIRVLNNYKTSLCEEGRILVEKLRSLEAQVFQVYRRVILKV